MVLAFMVPWNIKVLGIMFTVVPQFPLVPDVRRCWMSARQHYATYFTFTFCWGKTKAQKCEAAFSRQMFNLGQSDSTYIAHLFPWYLTVSCLYLVHYLPIKSAKNLLLIFVRVWKRMSQFTVLLERFYTHITRSQWS